MEHSSLEKSKLNVSSAAQLCYAKSLRELNLASTGAR